MNDVVSQISKVLAEIRSAWRFRWYGAALAWTGCILGWLVVAALPNVYEASATVYVDTSSVLKPILTNQIVPPDVVAELTYVNQALLGRAHLERVAKENELAAAASTPAELNGVLSKLRRGIQIEVRSLSDQPGNVMATISYRNADRDKSIGVVDTLLTSLVEGTLGATQEGSNTAGQFLEERIEEYEGRLQQAEQALADFKKRNSDRLPGAEGGYFARIQAERSALDAQRRQLRLAQSKAEQLRGQLNSASPVMPNGAADSQLPANSIDARIRDYHAQLDRLLLQYTEKHPDVIAMRETLSQLEEQRGEQLRALGILNPNEELSRLGSNPVYQALQIALNQTEVEIASLESDVSERTANLQQLQALADEVPEVEAELARLNRDYDVVYSQYQNLIKSRETQTLSDRASDADQIEFRVINPPLADFEPVAPNRVLLAFGVFGAALLAGAGVCWILAQARPVFTNAATLRAVCGLPVLGIVTQAFGRKQQLQRAAAFFSFAGIMAALGVMLLAIVYLETLGRGVHELLVGST
jgi:polysaccharide chain length determinant protein (PEP-CTERM system associated)